MQRILNFLAALGAAVLTLLLAIFCLGGSPAQAQLAGTGAITGTVTDPSGAVVPNATITATDVNTNVKTVRRSTSAGDYNITPLTPGTYTVTAAASGFEQFVQQSIVVNALATATVNIKLSVGAASQTVTVTTAPPNLNTNDASLGAVMDNKMYSSLPLEMGQGGNADQRRATDFEYLMPGVQANYTSNNSTDNSGIVNGSGPSGGVSEIYIEGVNLPEADQVGDPRFTWTAIGVDAVNQFQVQTAGYSAQYAGQGVQNYSIKSGGNQIHGSVYEYLRNTVLDAWKFTSKVPTINSAGVTVPGGIKPAEIQNEYGIVINGPIIKNKLFLFYNYGQYRQSAGATYAALTIPTAAMLGYNVNGTALGYADFSGYSTATGYPIYDPATQVPNCSSCTRTQFMGMKNGVPTPNVIPGNRISTAASYFNKFMLPYETLADQNAFANNLTYGRPTGLYNWYQTGRLDYDMNPANQISIIVAFGRQASTGTNSVGAGQLGPPFNTSQSYAPKTTVDILKDTWTITPHIVNQFAVAYGRYASLSTTPNLAPAYAAAASGILGMPPGQSVDGFPEIQFSGGSDNPGTQGGYAWNDKVNNTYTITDNAQWVFGKHNFTFGGQVVQQQFNYYKVLTASGPMDFTFSNSQTGEFTTGSTLNSTSGSSVASYMLGAASSGSTSANIPGLGSRWLDPSFWFQDDYKVSPKLTVNLGLRWDIFPSIHEIHNIFSFLNPTGANSVTGNLGTLQFAGNGSGPLYCNCKTPSPVFYKNIGPRIGLAYQLAPKTVLRASYDVAYARGDWTSGSQSGSPATLGFTPTAASPSGISSAPAFYWDNTACSTGNADSVPCGWTGSVAPPTPPAGGTSLAEYGTGETVALTNKTASGMTYFDPYYGSRTPEYINWTFGLQRELTRNMSISVSYVGSQGHFLSAGKAIGSRNNELPESMAALAGYTLASSTGTTATPCSGNNCPYSVLTQKATATNLGIAQSLGFKVPNPYNASSAAYYASNTVNQYYEPFPQFSGVSDTTSFVGNTNFHALEISLRQRESYGLDMMLNYTYSKSMDDIGSFRVGDNTRLDRSLSTTDEPQNLTATAVYTLPFGPGKIGANNFLVRSLAGGWLLSGIYTYHSGSPLVATGSGCGGSGILNQCMPFIVPGQAGRTNLAYGKNITAANYSKPQYVNPAAFTVNAAGSSSQYGTSISSTSQQVTYVGNGPALYAPGNAARVGALNVWGMGAYDLDLGLRRTFPIYREWNFQLEANMINATNHVVWNQPGGGVNSGSGFGTITSLNAAIIPRDVQLSGRINW